MTVAWNPDAIDDRERIHAELVLRNPAAADRQDAAIEAAGEALDGVATYAEGPLPGTRIYTCSGGKYLLIYTRDGDHVEILWVAPSRSNWLTVGHEIPDGGN